ncbi:putative mediator of RNA polymerase II transcription subunit 12 [Eupeodes corollae]|uniref:putative mediator of RNA polymerase II transcription subunit 12 n=1 Tax=Eupeodes corollae TaxID=290404 RepID=UPI002491A935|nr:putative mediator of RNA polymerase II transcription subunit 12 [Eupeodes corollae]
MGSFKTTLLVCWLLIGILSAHGLDKTEEKSKVAPKEGNIKVEVSETKDKRQIGSRDTASYSNEKQDDPEQPQETIYGPKPNHFLIRPLSPHDQQLRNYQPTSRPHVQQLQALGPQLEQSQEIQHFAYLQDTSRGHQAKAVAEGKSQTLVKKPSTAAQLQQYAAEEQYAQQQLQSQAQAQVRFTPAHGQFRPSEYIPQPQQQEQQQQAQYQSLQEEHLLKLIEEELQARALQEAQARASYSQAGPQGRPAERQGLVNYRSKPEETPDYSGYSQAPRAGPNQGPQYFPHQQQQIRAHAQQQTPSQVNFYHGPSAISYRTLPNHPLAESSLEKEIEKLLESNRPSGYRHSSPPALLASRSPFLQPKSYSTTASPPTTVGQASQYYSPSVVQYSGFQPSPTAPTVSHDHQQHKKYVPTAFSTSQPQYAIESSPQPSKPSKSSTSNGQYRVKLHSHKSKPQGKQNLGPVQFYYGESSQQQQQQQQQQQHQQQQQQAQAQDYQQYVVPSSAAPSQSSIYVSQSTGLQPSQKVKTQSNTKQLELPPPDGKPITQAEFQALIDAGYPVQAVPVPVPVPYEQYIKDHPEYTGEQIDIPHRHSQRGAPSGGEGGAVTYLRPISSERQHQQQSRHPREQKEEITPGKNESS